MNRLLLTLFLLFLFLQTNFAQYSRKTVVLDMTGYSYETNASRYLSATGLMRLTGLPFDTTSDLITALNYPVIITGSRIADTAFTSAEKLLLENYVSGGGVFITSSLRDTGFFNLCGISSSTSSSGLYEINWNTTGFPGYFQLVNDSLETTVSLGDTAAATFFTRYYALNGAVSLGEYEDGTTALAHNTFGNGHVYTFGPDFRDVILRNQLDFDLNANRTYSNGFEPTTDVFVFIIRNIIRNHIPNSVYKYTSPQNSSSVLMITHDIDSDTGIDTMLHFSTWEASKNISAQYNLTTRYLNDAWMTAFYIGSWSKVHQLLNDGHVLASHSVGHFPDFDNETIFPFGTTGNTPATYQPQYFSGVTTGGSVLGELEVSKELIEDDHSVTVNSFRAGHLCFHDSLVYGLQEMGYLYNSTHSANNVLTGFPYRSMDIRSFSSSESSILEIPMTISDVFSSDPISSSNYMQKVGIWYDVTRRYKENNASTVLLIHPNRMYKLNALQSFVDSIPSDMLIYPFEKFGAFWNKRDSLAYHTELNGDTLLVKMDNDKLSVLQSFIIDDTGLDTVLFYDENNTSLNFLKQNYSTTQHLYYQENTSSVIESTKQDFSFMVYPNPFSDKINIVFNPGFDNGTLEIYDLHGKLLYSKLLKQSQVSISFNEFTNVPGVYILKAGNAEVQAYQKVIYSK